MALSWHLAHIPINQTRMRLVILLLAFIGCKSEAIKVIESKYEDREKTVQEIENKASHVKNTPESVALKEQLARSLKELRSVNTDLKACGIQNAGLQSRVDEANKRLEEAEFALGFLSAFRWALIGLGLLVALFLLIRFKVINIPFLS